jgi:adenosine deaminase
MTNTMATNTDVDIEFTRALPKAELHAHLSGSITPRTLHDIWETKQAKGQCLDLLDPLTVIQSGTQGFVNVQTFFPLFDKYINRICDDPDSIRRATKQVLQDFQADGVRYLELRTTPKANPISSMTMVEHIDLVEGVIREWNRDDAASRDLEMKVYLILCIDRRMSAAKAMEVVDLAISHHIHGGKNHYVVGVDLCGNPANGNVVAFTPAFAKAKEAGLKITVHTAETADNAGELGKSKQPV